MNLIVLALILLDDSKVGQYHEYVTVHDIYSRAAFFEEYN